MPQSNTSSVIKELTDKRDTGHRLGQSTSDLVALYGKTPIVQPTHADQGAVTTSVTSTVTTTNLASTVADLITLLNRLRTDGIALGSIKGAA